MKAFGLTNRLVSLLVAVVAVATVRCADPPPEAPKDLQELCGFLFEHNIDSDQTLLIEGLENLYEWMDGHGPRSATVTRSSTCRRARSRAPATPS